MIRLYCRERHVHAQHGRERAVHTQHEGKGQLCPECDELWQYAQVRLDKCPYQKGKTTCAKCPVHCYQPAMRDRVRTVMRYAGPRMLVRHPLMALQHLIDGLRKEPVRPRDT
jgi:hypothetical protein